MRSLPRPAFAGACRRRSPRARRFGLLLSALSCGIVGQAAASAWNRAAGDGLVILDYGAESGDSAFDARGRLAPARRYDKGEAAAYIEYGATDSLTLLARTAFDRIAVAAPDGGRYTGIGGASVGAQWQALVFGPAVLAAQGSVGLPGSTSRTDPAVAGNTSRLADMRLLAGVGLSVPFRPFLDLQGAYRIRSGAASEWHVDATAGFYPTDKLLLLAQAFATVPAGVPGPRPWTVRLDLKAVYALTPAWAVQGGVFETVAGHLTLRETGVTVGLWHTF